MVMKREGDEGGRRDGEMIGEKEDVNVRMFREEDCVEIRKMIKEAADYHDIDKISITVDKLKREGFGPKPKYSCLLAEDVHEDSTGKKPLLGLIIYCDTFSCLFGRIMHLDLWFVRDGHRGRKIAESEGVSKVDLICMAENKASRLLYSRRVRNFNHYANLLVIIRACVLTIEPITFNPCIYNSSTATTTFRSKKCERGRALDVVGVQ
ncbi:hypothetical protein HELRODRAFT_176841 [Helobdella robusta]|uniref:N-acetyltransferase domain-containing protein n=1 Tax=Helobdella robusta TaxID=6412 RepID=T1FAY4_HELRO|nr:hypothetical protein HELRODRAFT_176841 [Helobdella robusta]ESN98382.1 hypothetical protein HELRODRAFT_176841 [Helobdella robusta]